MARIRGPGFAGYHILLSRVDHGLVSKLLDSDEDAHAVAHLLYTHFLQNLLVAVD
jgi:hypothetical protein